MDGLFTLVTIHIGKQSTFITGVQAIMNGTIQMLVRPRHFNDLRESTYLLLIRIVTTKDGHLEITMSKQTQHGLDYQGGMLQSWNKLCFTGGYIEVSVSLPGSPQISGFWPG